MPSFQHILGVTPFSQGGNKSNVLFAPLLKCGRAIRATSVASFYPSRNPSNDKFGVKVKSLKVKSIKKKLKFTPCILFSEFCIPQSASCYLNSAT